MKKIYNTPRCKFINVESSEMLAQSGETMRRGTGEAPTEMESNKRSFNMWDE